ncbi:MAG: hypothetical protein FJ297_06095 [Planctomycetes bacterium]|nr:hypothetical protein [Planctomycetota bacterium]
MTANWARCVTRALHLRIPPDLASWLDGEIWRTPIGAEFRFARAADQLVAPAAGSIWSGFMPPDALPLIGNGYGDWLCLRIGFAGEVSEITYWNHAGGDWIPYGRTLAEALTYDAAFHLLHGHRFPELERADRPSEEVFGAVEWAWPWLRNRTRRITPFWRDDKAFFGGFPMDSIGLDADGNRIDPSLAVELLHELLAARIAEPAARRDLMLLSLESPLKKRSRPAIARELATPWEPDFVSWLFDARLVPESARGKLSRYFDLPEQNLLAQDWGAAEREALRVIGDRDDLGWAWDVVGWAAERRGDPRGAIGAYRNGVRASLFCDDAVRFRTHWFPEGFGKFSAARLAALRDHLTDDERDDPYLDLFWKNDPLTLRSRVRAYWIERGELAEAEGRHWDAYRAYYGAGWDCGHSDLAAYGELVERMTRSAARAGSRALAELARLHRAQLRP